MPKFRVELDVEQASGIQTFEVEAETVSEAFAKLEADSGEIVEHEVEVTHLSDLHERDIYEHEG